MCPFMRSSNPEGAIPVNGEARGKLLNLANPGADTGWTDGPDGFGKALVLHNNNGTANHLSNVLDFTGTVDASGTMTLVVNPSSARSAINGFELPPPFPSPRPSPFSASADSACSATGAEPDKTRIPPSRRICTAELIQPSPSPAPRAAGIFLVAGGGFLESPREIP